MEYFSIWYVPSDGNGFMRFVGVRDSIPDSKELIMSFVCQSADISSLSDFVLWHYHDDLYIGSVRLRYDSDIDSFREFFAHSSDPNPFHVFVQVED